MDVFQRAQQLGSKTYISEIPVVMITLLILCSLLVYYCPSIFPTRESGRYKSKKNFLRR